MNDITIILAGLALMMGILFLVEERLQKIERLLLGMRGRFKEFDKAEDAKNKES